MKTSLSVDATGFLHHKAGYEIPVSIHAVPVHNQHGSIIGAVETFEELQSAANSNHPGESPKLPGFIDEVTTVATPTLMRSYWRHALATFVQGQVPLRVLSLRLEVCTHFRAALSPQRTAPTTRQ